MGDMKGHYKKIGEITEKYLKWYLYPLIYFVASSLVCLYAWYGPYPKGAVKIIYKTIAFIPSLLGIGIITLWIIIVVIPGITSIYLKKRAKDSLIVRLFQKEPASSRNTEEKLVQKTPHSLRIKIINSLLYSFGTVLIVSGILLLIWIVRPYFSLLLSSSKIAALEKKVASGQVQGNRIIIPSVLVDAPIIEGTSKGKLSRGVCRVTNSSVPGDGGNCIIEGHNLAEFGFWKPQSFFSILEVVDKGTPIYVFYDGKKYMYKVNEKTYLHVNNPKLYDVSPGERLTLITCVSTWSTALYTNKRTVVIAYPEF